MEPGERMTTRRTGLVHYDAVFGYVTVSIQEVTPARKRRFEEGLVMWGFVNGNRFWRSSF
jgi:hypothetical protein